MNIWIFLIIYISSTIVAQVQNITFLVAVCMITAHLEPLLLLWLCRMKLMQIKFTLNEVYAKGFYLGTRSINFLHQGLNIIILWHGRSLWFSLYSSIYKYYIDITNYVWCIDPYIVFYKIILSMKPHQYKDDSMPFFPNLLIEHVLRIRVVCIEMYVQMWYTTFFLFYEYWIRSGASISFEWLVKSDWMTFHILSSSIGEKKYLTIWRVNVYTIFYKRWY